MFSTRSARWLYILILMLFITARAFGADESFTVKAIRVQGLQRISEGTVYNYLPINVGDQVDAQRLATALRALYKTGFFRDVEFRQVGEGTLLVIVRERPSIAKFTITGNKSIKTENLDKTMKGLGLAEGRVLDRSLLDHVKQSLLNEYYSRGKYNVKVNFEVADKPNNQVDITLTISEGVTATVRSINIIGNHSFDNDRLLDLFQLKTPRFWSWFQSSDQYQREKLVGDLEKLRSFYMDRGYADFRVESTMVSISPDRKNVYITIVINEGAVYKVKDVKLLGDMVVPADDLRRYILVRPGSTFSMQLATTSADLISKRLGFDGFAFANVQPIPDLDRKKKQVTLTFFVDPGNRAYVRQINFSGAPGTDDSVFRREMRQFEGTWLSSAESERSRVRLERLPFVEKATVSTDRVPGSPDLVDLNYKIKERRSGTAQVGLGYSTGAGLLLSGQVVESNFLGSGKRLQLGLNSSVLGKNYNVSYTEPYYTVNGVSRTLGAFYRTSDFQVRGASPLNSTSWGFNVSYGFPISEYSAYNLGGQFSTTELITSTRGGTISSQQLIDFATNPVNGETFLTSLGPGIRYKTLALTAGWVHDTRNRVVLPTRGTRQDASINVAVKPGDLEYYIGTYSLQSYLPLGAGFIFAVNSSASLIKPYGATPEIPPTIRFFGGGPDSVRGYEQGYLGPKDSFGNPFGGTLFTYAQNELVLPDFFSKDKNVRQSSSNRFSLFVDIGNVFDQPSDFRFKDLRASYGIAATFLTPLGAMRFSYAFPLHSKPGDRTKRFQFALGAYF